MVFGSKIKSSQKLENVHSTILKGSWWMLLKCQWQDEVCCPSKGSLRRTRRDTTVRELQLLQFPLLLWHLTFSLRLWRKSFLTCPYALLCGRMTDDKVSSVMNSTLFSFLFLVPLINCPIISHSQSFSVLESYILEQSRSRYVSWMKGLRMLSPEPWHFPRLERS